MPFQGIKYINILMKYRKIHYAMSIISHAIIST